MQQIELLTIELLIVIVAAVLMDIILGELPSRLHPVVWIGKSIEKLKSLFLSTSKTKNRFSGLIMTLLIIIMFTVLFSIIQYISSFNYIFYLLVASIILSTTFAIRSLVNFVHDVYVNINEDLEKGRKSVSFLVSRETSNLSSENVVSAAIETLTENITDSVVSPIFYIFIFGFMGNILLYLIHPSVTINPFLINNISFQDPLLNFLSASGIGYSWYQFPIILAVLAGVSYRVVNTLDAMIGYKNPENIDIGWFPARLDDILNYIPARITGFLVVLASIFGGFDYRSSWKVMLSDARSTPSPNSGYSMAAAAGSLGIQLIKPEVYKLGYPKNELKPEMIKRAIKLTIITVTLYILIIILILFFTFLFFN
ncbi:cobalamin biosynthesis protein [uncultured Methanobacterium sp.]|uniref:cobalamin biosynthesis protein n=1 Tax=uncultured Methanobacterium sp. TaxID=176306 RepID=UPI002AA8ACE0|nr:cobalamin biosynthesis protein [uncultured Methanobacterium sp.]